MAEFVSWKSAMFWVIFLLLIVSGCTSSKSDPTPTDTTTDVTQVTLTISGSGGTARILTAIKPPFEADTPGYNLEMLSGTGTGGGVRGVTEQILDVAAMGRPPKDEETAQGIEYVEFGLAGQAIFIHPDVGITDLTTEQVTAIFFGEITKWSEVGGSDLTINVYVRDENDSSTAALREAIFGDTPFPESLVQIITSQGDMQTVIENTPGAVGFGTWPAVLAEGADFEAVALDGIAPGAADYPIFTRLGVAYVTDRQSDVQSLIDWLLSEVGQEALQQFGVIITTQ
jgi:phosphate transport system substrate-binding protein